MVRASPDRSTRDRKAPAPADHAATRDRLRAAFTEPERLKPARTRQQLTEEAAGTFVALTERLRDRGRDAQAVAHFVNRLAFCMFSEDVGLLPRAMFTRMLEHAASAPGEFQELAAALFATMRAGGRVGFERVDWFNGGLFDEPTKSRAPCCDAAFPPGADI